MKTNNEKITKKVEQMLAERDEALHPIWVRAPRSGQTEFYTGLGRGKLYQLASSGRLKTAVLKAPGTIRGVRLFNLKSLLHYVDSCTERSKGHESSTSKPTAA